MPNVSLAEFYADKRVLVTGGFGFVGSHLATTLASYGARVTALDADVSAERPSLLNVSSLRERVTAVSGDVTSAELMNRLSAAARFDYVFHLAAYATVIERAVENPYATIQSNTMGTINVLESIRLLPPAARPKAVVLTSTDKVYGDMEGEAYEEDRTPLRGIGVYDSAKLAADVFARTYHEVFGLPTVVLRMCNIFGPHDYSDYRLFPRAMKALFCSETPAPPELYFPAIEHWRDYLHVEDAVRALLLLGCEPACRGDVFNLHATAYLSTAEMLKKIVEHAALVEERYDPDRARLIRANGIRVNGLSAPQGSGNRVIVIKKQHLDGKKIQRAVGFEPMVPLDEAISTTIEAYRSRYGRCTTPREAKEVPCRCNTNTIIDGAVVRVS